MKNTTELRNELVSVLQDLRSRSIDVQTAKAIVGTSNSLLKSAQLEMEHSKMTGSKKKIDFLESPE